MSFDTFDFRARTLPMIVVWFPAILTAAVIAAGYPAVHRLGTLLPLPLTFVLTVLAAHIARDAGKKIEASLWDAWGGPPATARLRWASAQNPVLHQDLHTNIQAIVGAQLQLPTKEEELADPVHADHVYETVVRTLIARTTSKDDYAKLKNDLIWYSFRRNLYGLRRFAYWVDALLIIASIAAVVVLIRTSLDFSLTAPVIGFLAAAMSVIFFSCTVTAEWVRLSAEAYADELIKYVYVAPSGTGPI
ncbi:hypothetical protein [Rhodococcus sp. YH3-3]|uniref:hypothetical protein n=1 Tax=Rhodococcus sp. YH3-3 TaxID=1803579 RepID=UPI000B2E27B0|nr:hypothetical protein [Rhodococcus sp. YH3-3]